MALVCNCAPIHADFLGFSYAERTSALLITNPMHAETIQKEPSSATPPAFWRSALDLPAPVEVAQTNFGKIHLAALLPAGWAILVYEGPDGSLIPAKVLNPSGDVQSVEDVADGTVIWVAIDTDGFVKPLQKEPSGDLKPARVDAQGQPVLDDPVPENTKVFAAQLSDTGNILPILRSLTEGFISVRLTDRGALVRVEPETAPKSKAEKKLSGSMVVDNSGGGETGPQNVTATVAYEDIYGSGHNVLLSATTSASHPDDSKSAFATYTIPITGRLEELPNQLALSAYYYDIDYNITVLNQSAPAKFAINGYGISPSYTQYLSLSEGDGSAQTVQALIYSALFDRYWTRDFGQGQDSRTSLVRIPLSIAYGVWHGSDAIGTANARIKYTRNLPIGAAGNGDDYRADRTNADPKYDKINLSLFHQWPAFDGWNLSEAVRAQFARDPLIAAEGFSLGGQYSVRGLETSRTIGDAGATIQVELGTPDLIANDNVDGRVFGFVDAGMVEVRQSVSGVGSDSAVGTGIGARLSGFDGLFANISAGWLVGGAALERYKSEDGRLQLYFSAGFNF